MEKINFNPSYVGQRLDILKLISNKPKLVLDVGCSTGILGSEIKTKTGAQVFGIEVSKEMAEEALNRIDKVFIGDVAEVVSVGNLEGYKFDTIIFADVLEHLEDPWSVLKKMSTYLLPNGKIIASIPNIRHLDTLYNLMIRGIWPYRERGIHDRTHLRFFTKRNIVELFNGANLLIDLIESKYRFIERPHRINRFAKYLAIPVLKDFLTFQYLICAHLNS